MKEPCELLVKKMEEHNAITKCPYCQKLFDIHVGMIFLEGKEIEDSNKWGHEYFEKVMKMPIEPTKITPIRTIMKNETIRKLIRKRATEIRDMAKSGGEKACPNCGQEAWLLIKKNREQAILCPNCGYDELELDWTDITEPLPRPPML